MPRYTYDRLTPSQLSAGLNEAKITLHQFCRLSGSDPRRVQRWLDGTEDGPPLWAGMLLTALTVPDARARMLAYADAVVRRTDDPPDG